jgi:hypothetical protein
LSNLIQEVRRRLKLMLIFSNGKTNGYLLNIHSSAKVNFTNPFPQNTDMTMQEMWSVLPIKLCTTSRIDTTHKITSRNNYTLQLTFKHCAVHQKENRQSAWTNAARKMLVKFSPWWSLADLFKADAAHYPPPVSFGKKYWRFKTQLQNVKCHPNDDIWVWVKHFYLV